MRALTAVRARLASRHALEIEMMLAGVAVLAWQAVRIPLEGTVGRSLAHAESWLRLEQMLDIDVEAALIRVGSSPSLHGPLEWGYENLHVPAIFAFLAAARLLAPDRYPRLRTTFLLSFLPALVVIGLYPLAPPLWLPELGLGSAPAEGDLTGTLRALLENSTAAAASQHFGFALFIACGSLWLAPRSSLAWATLVYPALVFVVIVGTGNHYVLDCAVGAGTFALGAVGARIVHGRTLPSRARPPWPPGWAGLAVSGYAAVAWGVEKLAGGESPAAAAGAVSIGVACALAPRLRDRLAAPTRA